ncbi:hypothetical protein QFZ60_001616 [Arthrobacter sp. B2I5]|uniref:hypothetical protein n=1 Tax=Arthrobacter sp. B2I5 TaxID=3042266 RepID=UPI00277F0A89|nr:hypothetical protein [Arthrobacter sp. B2I5]MDQ0825443.1 hypothetical protein [Arthrobacter sp. B2I5]
MEELTAEEEGDLIERTAAYIKKLALGDGLNELAVQRLGTGEQAGIFEDDDPETVVEVLTGMAMEAIDTPAMRAIRNALGFTYEGTTTLTERREAYKQKAGISMSTAIRHEQQGAEDLAGYIVRRILMRERQGETPLEKLEQRVRDLEMLLALVVLPKELPLEDEFREKLMKASKGTFMPYVTRVGAAVHSYEERFPEEFTPSSESQPDQD